MNKILHTSDSKPETASKKHQLFFIAAAVAMVLTTMGAMGIVKRLRETVFFDRLIFYKKPAFGYWVPGKELSLDSFGTRSESIVKLHRDWQALEQNAINSKNVLGVTTQDNKLTIAVIGDSYTWGQGVRFEDTYPQVLEQMLTSALDTEVEVVVFAEVGNSILDYAVLFQISRQLYDVDFYVFGLVLNDIYPTESRIDWLLKNTNVIQECDRLHPDQKLVVEEFKEEFINNPEDEKEYALGLMRSAWNSDENWCLLQRSLELLPDSHSLYFAVDDYWGDDDFWNSYLAALVKDGKDTYSIIEMKNDPQFSSYMAQPEKYLRVSSTEIHPSKLAHQMYAEFLFRKLLPQFTSN